MLRVSPSTVLSLFFFTDTPPTEIYTLSLHDALPISQCGTARFFPCDDEHDKPPSPFGAYVCLERIEAWRRQPLLLLRSEEHTSELQSHHDLVCRLLLEKKKKKKK